MGHLHSTAVIVDVGVDGPVKLSTSYDDKLGAYYFDLKLFEHFAAICEKKHGSKVGYNE